MSRPRLLDLFCGAGGAAMGYHRAGFEVVGVDIKPQKHYPFEFHQADAMTYPLDGFDVIHASPPCQNYSSAMRHRQTKGKEKPRLIDAMRDRLSIYRLWVIENVNGSGLPDRSTLFGSHGAMLCGTALGLQRVWRHRFFEASIPLRVVECRHTARPLNPYNAQSRIRDGLQTGSMKAYAIAMGVDWMLDKEATEAIPPAYTEFIGKQLMEHLKPHAAVEKKEAVGE